MTGEDEQPSVWEQIRAFYEQHPADLPTPLTKISLSPSLMPWVLAHFPPTIGDSPITGLLGVPIVEDDCFRLGQVRLHYGERFQDFYAIPPGAPTHLAARGAGPEIEPWDVFAAIRGF